MVVGGNAVPLRAAAEPGPDPSCPSALPPGPFSLSETQSPELSPVPQLILPAGWRGVESSVLSPEERGPGKGSGMPGFKPRKTNPGPQPTLSGLSHQAVLPGCRVSPSARGSPERALSAKVASVREKTGQQALQGHVGAHMSAHVSSHVHRERQVTPAWLLLNQVPKQ